MSNVWVVCDPWGEVKDEFLSRDFDPQQVWEDWGYYGHVSIHDKTDRMRVVCTIEAREGTSDGWVQPYDLDGNPVPYAIR